MRHIAPIARILLGLVFLTFAINYFAPFLPPQPAPPAEALGFLGGLVATKILTFVKVVEVVAAIGLLTNRFVPLALALLAPITIGILLIHLTILPAGLPIALALVGLELFLAWSYRSAFLPMLRAKTAPDPVAHSVRVPALTVA